MRRCQALTLTVPVSIPPRILLGACRWPLRRPTSAISAHSACRSKLRLQRLSVWAKEPRNGFWHLATAWHIAIAVAWGVIADMAGRVGNDAFDPKRTSKPPRRTTARTTVIVVGLGRRFRRSIEQLTIFSQTEKLVVPGAAFLRPAKPHQYSCDRHE